MPIPHIVFVLGLILLIPLPLAGVAVAADLRSRSGRGQVVLAAAIAVVYIIAAFNLSGLIAADQRAGVGICTPPVPTPGFRGLGVGLTTVWVALILIVELALYVTSSLAGLVVAAVSRQWGWFAAIATGMLPMAAVFITGTQSADLCGFYRNGSLFYAALFCPLLLCLIYGWRRSRSPYGASGAWQGD